MAKKDKDKIQVPEAEPVSTSAGNGMVSRIVLAVFIILTAAVAISIVSDLNVGRTPELFGFALSFLG